MANPDRNTAYRDDTTTNRTIYSRRSSATGWFVGIVVALALLAIGFLVFNANTGPATGPATVDTTVTQPMAPATEPTPMTTAPATEPVAPAVEPAAPATTTPAAPDTATPPPAPVQ